LRAILNKLPRISTPNAISNPDQSQIVTLQSVKRYQPLQRGNQERGSAGGGGYPSQVRRTFSSSFHFPTCILNKCHLFALRLIYYSYEQFTTVSVSLLPCS
jgi:hypothetical protein